MRRWKYGRVGSGWQAEVTGLLLETLPLVDRGRLITRHVLASVLVWSSAVRGTLSSACRRTGIGVSDETLRQAIVASLPPIDHLPLLLESSLWSCRSRLRRARRQRGFDIAIDLHHQPYYGTQQAGLFSGQPKLGTKLFWSTATAAIVHRGERLTLAIVPVTRNRMDEVLDALWPQLGNLRVKVRRLLLDRGFYGAEVVAWMQKHRVSFLMPMIRRGRRSTKRSPGTGTAPFFVRGRRGLTTYTWQQRRRDRHKVSVDVAIVPHPDRRRRPLVFAYSGRLPHGSYCRWLYKKRFGIETTYRQARQSRAWTTSRDPRWRRLLIVLSFMLLNVWMLNQSNAPAAPRSQQLTYPHFLQLLAESIQAEWPQTPRGPPLPIPTNFGSTEECLCSESGGVSQVTDDAFEFVVRRERDDNLPRVLAGHLDLDLEAEVLLELFLQ